MNVHFRPEAIIFKSVGFTPLELQYLDARFIRSLESDKRPWGTRELSDQSFLAVALTMASACVNALIQLQGRPADVHGFGEARYSGLLSSRQIARANYYYLLWENLNNDPTDIGSDDWWKWQREQLAMIIVAVGEEYPDDCGTPPPVDEQTITPADVGPIPDGVVGLETP